MDQELIKLEDISAGYDKEIVLKEVSLSVFEKDFIGVIGPNGGGKTTLVKVIMGLIKPAKGTITYTTVPAGQTLIGYLPQITQIDKKFPITVMDVVLSGLMSAGNSIRFSKADKEKAMVLLSKMGIADLRKKTIGELSGGQMQRVFLSRAIISSPKVLIMDEPNTFVDNKFEYDLYESLTEMNKNTAILLITHDIGIVTIYVKTIACVNSYVHYHNSNIITEEQLASYNCPVQIVMHGNLPHTVLQTHQHHTHE